MESVETDWKSHKNIQIHVRPCTLDMCVYVAELRSQTGQTSVNDRHPCTQRIDSKWMRVYYTKRNMGLASQAPSHVCSYITAHPSL